MQTRVRAMLSEQNVEVLNTYSNLVNGFAVKVPAGGYPAVDRARLEALPGVVAVRPVRLHKRFLNTALQVHAITDAWASLGGKDKAGAGIKVGILDTGIDITNAMFQDAALSAPAGFPKVNRDADLVYTNGKVIVARGYPTTGSTATAKDDEGHGTAVASVVAGVTANRNGVPITGVAPGAWLGNYKVFPDPNSGAPDNLIIQALTDAVADGMDIVNLSLGSDLADPVDVDPLEIAVQNAVAQGMVVTISAGNDGPDPNTVGTPALAPASIAAAALVNGHYFSSQVTRSDGVTVPAIRADFTNTTGSQSGTLKDIADLDPTGLACSALPAGSLSGKVALIFRGVCFFDDKIANAEAAGATMVIIYTDAARPDPIAMSVSGPSLPAFMVSYSNGLSLKTLAAAGGSVSVNFADNEFAQPATQIADFSSRGPAIDGSLKPDILATGSSMVMAQAGGTFRIADGTSFSAPMIAGSAAIVKGARPGLTAAQYKSLLVNSARPFYNKATTQGQTADAGGGVLQVLSALNAGATFDPVSLSFGVGPAASTLSQTFTITNVEAQDDTFTLEAVVQSGPSPTLSAPGAAAGSSSSRVVLPLAKGASQTVTITLNPIGLPAGPAQGSIRVKADHAIAMERVPWWYSVPSQTPAHVTFLDNSGCALPSSTVTVFFRVTDENGVPVTAITPTAIATAGNTAAPTIASYFPTRISPALPGTYVLTGTAASRLVQSYSITAGSVVQALDLAITSSCN
ncbi:MAG: S8 family serine peptidase [Bryobacteraceae bacterium]